MNARLLYHETDLSLRQASLLPGSKAALFLLESLARKPERPPVLGHRSDHVFWRAFRHFHFDIQRHRHPPRRQGRSGG